MLIIRERDQAYFRRVVDFACAKGLAESLFAQLLFLHTHGDPDATGRSEVVLSRDFAPASFSLAWCKPSPNGDKDVLMQGGLIFHGDQSGWRRDDGTPLTAPQPTFSVRL